MSCGVVKEELCAYLAVSNPLGGQGPRLPGVTIPDELLTCRQQRYRLECQTQVFERSLFFFIVRKRHGGNALYGCNVPKYYRIRFVLLCSVVFFFHLVFGYFQEWIFRQEGMKPHGWYLTLLQFLMYTLFSGVDLSVKGSFNSSRIPLSAYAVMAAATLGTMGLSNASLGYLNYPTQVIFKSCKLVPVLAGGVLIQGKQYKLADFIAAAVMCVGVAAFTLADAAVSPNFDPFGVAMICGALVADAVVGNVQERAMRHYSAAAAEIVFHSYALGSLALILGLAVTGGLMEGIAFFGSQLYAATLVYSVTGYVGMQAVLSLVRHFGAFACVSVTSMRKVLSIALSFIIFDKPFTVNYIYSGMLVLLGVYLNVAAKNKSFLTDLMRKLCMTRSRNVVTARKAAMAV